jgi:hypothetical protein
MTLRWLMVWIAMCAVLLGIDVYFGMLLNKSSIDPPGTALIAIAPFAAIIGAVFSFPYSRSSPVVFVALSGGALLITIVVSFLFTKLLGGAALESEWPKSFMVCSLMELVGLLLLRRIEQEHQSGKRLIHSGPPKERQGEPESDTPGL